MVKAMRKTGCHEAWQQKKQIMLPLFVKSGPQGSIDEKSSEEFDSGSD
jgi:hypothetical protein